MAETTEKTVEKKTSDKASQEIIASAQKYGTQLVWDRYEMQSPHCRFGITGVC